MFEFCKKGDDIMKKILTITFYIIVLTAALFFTGCKPGEEPTGEFTLTVQTSTGVSGTPVTGTYYYDAGTTIVYNYTINENYSNLRVLFDSVAVDPSGTITITKDHTLNSYADPDYNILGTWAMEEEYSDNRAFTVTLVFTGDKASGTVTDSDGGTGAYTITNTTSISFTLVFPNATYTYTGLFKDVDEISGTSTRTNTAGEKLTGKWVAERTTAAAATQSLPGKKGN
jgi:hypothetical protein